MNRGEEYTVKNTSKNKLLFSKYTYHVRHQNPSCKELLSVRATLSLLQSEVHLNCRIDKGEKDESCLNNKETFPNQTLQSHFDIVADFILQTYNILRLSIL